MRQGKHAIRRRMETWRKRLARPEVERRSRLLASHVSSWLADRRAGTVAAYVAVRGEIDPAFLLPLLRTRGWRVCLPVTDPRSRLLSMRTHREGEPLRRGAFDIPEPAGGDPVAPDRVDLALVPGLAFDRAGHRVGFGGGYYDRWLLGLSGTSLGLCHAEQVVEEVPAAPLDVAVDAVATDEGVGECTSS